MGFGSCLPLKGWICITAADIFVFFLPYATLDVFSLSHSPLARARGLPSKLISKRTSRSETYYQLFPRLYLYADSPHLLRIKEVMTFHVTFNKFRLQVRTVNWVVVLQSSFLLMVQFNSWMLHQFMNCLLARQYLRPVFIYTACAYDCHASSIYHSCFFLLHHYRLCVYGLTAIISPCSSDKCSSSGHQWVRMMFLHWGGVLGSILE